MDIGHHDRGSEYTREVQRAYNHDAHGRLFLDPYFIPDIENLKSEKVLDAGCGAAVWSIYAAKQGGEVYAIDIQDGMLQLAKQAIEREGLTDRISLVKGDVALLPFEENFFDLAMSIFVGCCLPTFENHFSELCRTLKKDGIAVIGAPVNLDVVFSDGSKTDRETDAHIAEVLRGLPDHPSPQLISEELAKLDEVLFATFYMREGRLVLLSSERDLREGEKIWRKLPGLVVVPNFYHSQESYIKAFEKYNLEVTKIDLPHFRSEEERAVYNKEAGPSEKLGQAYVKYAPIATFHVKK